MVRCHTDGGRRLGCSTPVQAAGEAARRTHASVCRQAIRRGVTELHETARAGLAGRIRQPGGGRKRTTEKDPTCCATWSNWSSRPREAIRSRRCAGRARACAIWRRSCSDRAIASRISWSVSCCRGRATACRQIVRRIEGASHPDRSAQFDYIHRQVRACVRLGDPVISIDIKKRNRSATSRIAAASTVPRRSRNA